MSKKYEEIDEENLSYRKRVRQELDTLGYNGLVNMRTICISHEADVSEYRIEGTPITLENKVQD